MGGGGEGQAAAGLRPDREREVVGVVLAEEQVALAGVPLVCEEVVPALAQRGAEAQVAAEQLAVLGGEPAPEPVLDRRPVHRDRHRPGRVRGRPLGVRGDVRGDVHSCSRSRPFPPVPALLVLTALTASSALSALPGEATAPPGRHLP
ncbi:hypothetical protein Kpho01_12880 [Kitasatospora phosalacinea]|uniref:Uncharacterized protein n=1 Tax=Kitasatospora phosalacinea TaxID=2065 RepID=A0A9W6UMM2_9ACTN|nr:hypothetical protein Kpho01_12880 [Kitasatospora phosalacinea]